MVLRDNINAIEQLTKIKWRWDVAGWKENVVALGLIDVDGNGETGKTYKTYRFQSGIAVYAFVNRQNLQFVHLVLNQSQDLEGRSDEEIQTIERNSQEIYREVVDQTINILGRPIFDGNRNDSDYPKDIGAEYGAMWYIDNAKLIVLLQYGEDEFISSSIYANVFPSDDNELR